MIDQFDLTGLTKSEAIDGKGLEQPFEPGLVLAEGIEWDNPLDTTIIDGINVPIGNKIAASLGQIIDSFGVIE